MNTFQKTSFDFRVGSDRVGSDRHLGSAAVSALPPDVRQGSALPEQIKRTEGLSPWFGLSPYRGRSPKLVNDSTAGRSPASHPAAEPKRERRALPHIRRQSRNERDESCSHPAAEPKRERRVLLTSGGRAETRESSPASHPAAEPKRERRVLLTSGGRAETRETSPAHIRRQSRGGSDNEILKANDEQ
jgi:hypothetical protein